mmetsp:Transcript_16167/g.39752  ORF Transcript_16167/g.39752 Transcript_16167/m.39752 type:complete len:108 (+) Transcript_16167:615-938(+)
MNRRCETGPKELYKSDTNTNPSFKPTMEWLVLQWQQPSTFCMDKKNGYKPIKACGQMRFVELFPFLFLKTKSIQSTSGDFTLPPRSIQEVDLIVQNMFPPPPGIVLS